ncbi:DEAD/DEAH box helicase [Synoicihabitans lomoniglobus]|uniref:DEAD/DEAH box helicase n=1 Tax=Synoicihabitans lomoniglobus TaxID=2909285 RepID=A0AAF0CPD2_9BACT|nr:DEAD/DEAH box helicase [Opitutaceae bacterium LMO-M01]WED64129.1 DEAD/DEAH box helicase [Opitutaceae bacterium LMO-M01]
MSGFEKLDPLVQHHIVNTLGWRGLRPLQERSIEPILAGEHCLLLAPTAGGKTEAAIFPVLSKLCSENWTGLSVIYVCPLRALLNNLHIRLQVYCAMVGRTCGIWHGDVRASERKKVHADHPDILLTTPESLEVMLISAHPDGREMLKSVRIVVIDEIHAFAADDRGWHMLAVLERVGRLAGRELQRLGLSATVGNPDELLQWLAGHCEGNRRVVSPPAETSTIRTDVQLDYVGSIENAALVISRIFRGEKRLVFCDSRARVELLGNELRELGVSCFLSHSSLSAEERRSAEAAFAEAQDCVIVATSTLELGIDVGDLDRVIQIDAPFSVASFLQRLGRTGRREGAVRNCLFLATSETALLRAGALLQLWEGGFVEPVQPPKHPLHLFAQQLMALSLQEKGIGVQDWKDWVSRLPPFFGVTDAEFNEVMDHLLAQEILFSDGVRLSFGDEGISRYGRRHFIELVSVFTSPPLFRVLHGRKELGTVHQIAFVRHRENEPAVLSLGGRSWVVESIEWPKRIAYVIPSKEKGKRQWISSQFGMPFALCQGVQALLKGSEEPERWSSRAKEKMASLRQDYEVLNREGDTVLVAQEDNKISWFTFAGSVLNAGIADLLIQLGISDVRATDFAVTLKGTTDVQRLLNEIERLIPADIRAAFQVSEEYLNNLKFSECLPLNTAEGIVRKRSIALAHLKEILARRRNVVLTNKGEPE